jgi:hypothetical protein
MTPLAAGPMRKVRKALGMQMGKPREREPAPMPLADAEVAGARAALKPELGRDRRRGTRRDHLDDGGEALLGTAASHKPVELAGAMEPLQLERTGVLKAQL